MPRLKSIEFAFNASIMLPEPDGTFNTDALGFAEICTMMKGTDGIESCRFGQYGVAVSYVPTVISPTEVFTTARACVEWVASQSRFGLFPLRGDKTPTVLPPTLPEKVTIVARCNSHLMHFFPLESGARGWDRRLFLRETDPLANKLTDIDGVLDYQMLPDGATLTINTLITGVDTAQQYMLNVLRGVADDPGNDYFPFLEDSEKELVVTFSLADEI